MRRFRRAIVWVACWRNRLSLGVHRHRYDLVASFYIEGRLFVTLRQLLNQCAAGQVAADVNDFEDEILRAHVSKIEKASLGTLLTPLCLHVSNSLHLVALEEKIRPLLLQTVPCHLQLLTIVQAPQSPLPPTSFVTISYLPLPVITAASSAYPNHPSFRRASIVTLALPHLHACVSSHAIAHHLLAVAQSLLDKSEGVLSNVLVDEVGLRIVGAFGTPPFAHVDDPSRAARFALDFAAAAVDTATTLEPGTHSPGDVASPQYPFVGAVRVSVGISTGLVFCGEVGEAERFEFMLAGEVVDMSCRMSKFDINDIPIEQADDSVISACVLVCPVTAAAICASYVLTPLPACASSSLAACKLMGTKRTEPHPFPVPEDVFPGPFVGRQEVVSMFDSIFDISEPSSMALVVAGAQGMGKSRTLEHLSLAARSRGFAVVYCRGDAFFRTACWVVASSLLAQLIAEAKRYPDFALLSDLEIAKKYTPPHLIDYLDVASCLFKSANPSCRYVEPNARGELATALGVAVVCGLVADLQLRLCVIVDDLDLADVLSMDFIKVLRSQASSVLFLAAVTSDGADNTAMKDLICDTFGDRCCATELQPLDVLAAAEMARALMGGEGVPQRRIENAVAQAGGHPFRCAEWCFLMSEGALTASSGTTPIHLHSASLNAVVQLRAAACSAEESSVLRAAAALGVIVDLRLLAAVMAIIEPCSVPLNQILDSLIEARFLVPPTDDNVTRFLSAAVRSEIDSTAARNAQAAVHSAAAKALTESRSLRLRTVTVEVARHFSLSGKKFVTIFCVLIPQGSSRAVVHGGSE